MSWLSAIKKRLFAENMRVLKLSDKEIIEERKSMADLKAMKRSIDFIRASTFDESKAIKRIINEYERKRQFLSNELKGVKVFERIEKLVDGYENNIQKLIRQINNTMRKDKTLDVPRLEKFNFFNILNQNIIKEVKIHKRLARKEIEVLKNEFTSITDYIKFQKSMVDSIKNLKEVNEKQLKSAYMFETLIRKEIKNDEEKLKQDLEQLTLAQEEIVEVKMKAYRARRSA